MIRRAGLTAGCLLAVTHVASGWDADDYPLWPDGTLELRMMLHSSPIYSDGDNPNRVGLAAIEQWNPYMGRLQIVGSIGVPSGKGNGNGRSEAFFDTKVYGEDFPVNALAVTIIRYNQTRRTEADVAVNSAYQWDSYRGGLNAKQDLRRVLAHEFGHVLGLDHPDEAGQFVTAVMNSHIGDIDSTVEDDQNGAAALYGHGTANPPVAPTIPDYEPYDQVVTAGERATFFVYPSGTEPLTYQWKKDGADIPGATNRELVFEAAKVADAGVYTVAVSNEAGTATSRGAVLTVNPGQPPSINWHPSSASVVIGSSASFSVGADGTYPLSFQWYKDGQPIDGAVNSWYDRWSISAADGGDYWVQVSNAAGTVTSDAAHLTILPLPPPQLYRLGNRTVTEGEWFSVDANLASYHPGTLEFQWYHNGQPIAGATASAYYVNQATYDDAGEYFVVVRNATGAVTSMVAFVEVLPGDTQPLGGWSRIVRAAGVVYFLFENPARIERFDLAANTFLPAIGLVKAPTALTAQGGYLYVAFGGEIVRMGMDGSGQTTMIDLGQAVADLASRGNHLYAIARDQSHGNSRGIASVDLTTFSIVAERSGDSYIGAGPSVDEAGGHLFFRTTEISPADITSLELHDDGTFGALQGSPYHGAYPWAEKTFVFPGNDRVVDDSGTVYHTADLGFAGTVGGRFQDIDFRADGRPVVLRSGKRVTLYSDAFADVGRLEFGEAGDAIAVWGDHVYLFSQPEIGGSTKAQRLALNDFSIPVPAAKVAPSNLAYTPDGVWLDQDDVLLLYSRLHRNIFRWSIPEQRYLESIPLLGSPNFVDYSAEQRRLYLGYPDNHIRTIALDHALEETSFATAPTSLQGMAAAGEYVFVNDPSGAWSSFLTYNSAGDLVSARDWSYYSRTYAWNSERRRLYHFRDEQSPNDLLYTEVLADGTIGDVVDSPYHGEFLPTPPIRISPGGDNILLGSGLFFNADTLQQNNALTNALEDAVWLDARLYTARTLLTGTEIQRWGSGNYTLDLSTVVSGRLVRFFAIEPGILAVVTMQGDYVRFVLLDPDLKVLNHFEGAGTDRARLINLSTRGLAGTGQNIMIAGFVVSGSTPKRVLVRGIGPSLAQFDVPGVLADPVLRVFNSAGQTIATNDNWNDASPQALRDAFAESYAFPLAEGSPDAALLLTLNPGLYTAHLSGSANGEGVGLIEIYDLDAKLEEHRLVNISTRAIVGTGHSLLIPGLVISGDRPKRVLIRAVGPSIAQFGLSDLLANPRIEVVSRLGEIVAVNDDWELAGASAVRTAELATGAFPLETGSRDAALVATLPQGSYTILVQGADAAPGLALVEVYEIP